jgi:flagellar hook-associated protein 3 FlgL
MRISTSQMHGNALNAMMKRQSELSKTQTEVASGLRVAKPSDDPVAMTRILKLEQEHHHAVRQQQCGRHQSTEPGRAGAGHAETTIQRLFIDGAGKQRIAECSDRQSIVTELTELKRNWWISPTARIPTTILFSGYASGTQPFTRDSNGDVAYSGATQPVNTGVEFTVRDRRRYRQFGVHGHRFRQQRVCSRR